MLVRHVHCSFGPCGLSYPLLVISCSCCIMGSPLPSAPGSVVLDLSCKTLALAWVALAKVEGLLLRALGGALRAVAIAMAWSSPLLLVVALVAMARAMWAMFDLSCNSLAVGSPLPGAPGSVVLVPSCNSLTVGSPLPGAPGSVVLDLSCIILASACMGSSTCSGRGSSGGGAGGGTGGNGKPHVWQWQGDLSCTSSRRSWKCGT